MSDSVSDLQREQMSKFKNEYRICIVTEALTNKNLYIFSWKDNAWRSIDNKVLNISEKTGAYVSV